MTSEEASKIIPDIKIDLASDDDTNAKINRAPNAKLVCRKKRHSCPGNFLTLPYEKDLLKKERRKLKCEEKKDLTKGMGMHTILNKIEKKKIDLIRRQKRRERRRLQKSACIPSGS